MEEYKGFKVGDRVRIRTLKEAYKNAGDEVVPKPFVRDFGGYDGIVHSIDGRIEVNIGTFTNPKIGYIHVEMLLEHRILVPDELFQI